MNRCLNADRGLKHINDSKGETLVEALASVLIIVMFFTALAGAVVASARVNSRIKNNSTTLVIRPEDNKVDLGTNVKVVIEDPTTSEKLEQEVDVYVTKDDEEKPLYFFYRLR